jgi:hypothetical protein
MQSKVINKCTHIPYSHIGIKVNQHIEMMNVDGWELMSVAMEAIGIEELFIMFWRKPVEEVKPAVQST